MSWSALKAAYTQKDVAYFARVLPAVVFGARETLLAAEDVHMKYQFEKAKRDLEAQLRAQFNQSFTEEQYDMGVDENQQDNEAAESKAAVAA